MFLLFAGVTTSWGMTHAALLLNESQILYLFSTSAQVLAGVYGLTLTGFIFFRNELSREENEDETLTEAVESLKRRYFILLIFITTLVLVTFALSNLAISSESSTGKLVNNSLINAGQSAFATSLLAIAYFIFDVVSPRRIEQASRSLQDEVDPTHAAMGRGSLEEFLRNYNQIEMLLNDSALSYSITSLSQYPEKAPRRPSNARLAEILLRNERISEPLFAELKSLITLRNSIIHGADPVVSQDAVAASQRVLTGLRASLGYES